MTQSILSKSAAHHFFSFVRANGLRFFWGCFLALLISGCSGMGGGRQETALLPPGTPATGPVTLAAGDTLKMFYPAASEFNSIQKIRLDGKISLPLVGEVQAAGKPLSQLQTELSALYKPQLQNTEVMVTLEASGSPVVISGRVRSPGKYVFDRPTTLLEAILTAGGFDLSAKSDKVRLIRIVDGQYQTQTVNLGGPLAGGSAQVIYVKGGDLIYVPQSIW